MAVVLKMEGITKRFPKVIANQDVTVELEQGEVHGLLGENGAGKSTLMNCLYGLYHPDEGNIYIRGEKVKINNSDDATKLGIGMVHQHFMLVPEFTVAENVILGLKTKHEPLLKIEDVEKEVQALSDKYNFGINPKDKIKNLPVGIQQRVEIIKVLYRKAEILILDEATAVLTPQEVEELFSIIRQLTKEGKSVLIITHKMDEVMRLCNTISILRQGKLAGNVKVENTNPRELAQLMVGREVFLNFDRKPCTPGDDLVKVKNLNFTNKLGVKKLKHINFELRAGEILGIAGVDGNGQNELSEVLTGLVPWTDGEIEILGKVYKHIKPRDIYEAGISYIPQDRQKTGLVLDFNIKENFILQEFYKMPYSKNKILNETIIENHGKDLIEEFDIRASGTSVTARTLSGGNQQKVIVAREMDRNPKVLIAVQPTRGLDIGAIEFVRRQLVDARDNGAAVMMISTELEEIFSISDRIAVIFEGEFMGIVDPATTSLEEIGLMMAGTKRSEGDWGVNE